MGLRRLIVEIRELKLVQNSRPMFDDFGENGAALSGGTRQRVALTRALPGDPKIVVLDGSNTSLDVVGDNALISAINDRSARGLTTIIISHRPSILKNADKLLILRQGGTAVFGDCKTLFNTVN